MVKIGRNDPCPCGSGKKYKSCCMEADLPSGKVIHFPGTAAAPAVWQAGFITVPLPVSGDVSALPAVLMVVEGDRLLFSEVRDRVPAGPAGEAQEIERAVREASRVAAYAPDRVLVRDPAVAAVLALPDLSVSAVDALPDLDFIAADLFAAVAGLPELLSPDSPDTWAGWGLSAAQVAALFRASAAFYRAAPWEVLTDEVVIDAELPGGRRWTACVLGSGGMEYGLALYEEAEDLLGMLTAPDPMAALAALRGLALSLGFSSRDELPAPMVREVRKAGWEVVGPAAYPYLTVLNAPDGGISPVDMEDLTVLLEAVARVMEEIDSPEGGVPSPEWRDPVTGAVLRLSIIEGGWEESLWDAPTLLQPGCAEGAGAEPAAALDVPDDPDEFADAEAPVVGRFAKWLKRTGVSHATVDKHATNAGLFVDFLVRWEGVPHRAVTELDLRTFLYDWYPRKVSDTRTRALAVPTSLRRFFSFLAEAEGVACPWADPILRDRVAFERRLEEFPEGFWWDEGVKDWRAGLYDDLWERAFLPEQEMVRGEAWDGTMGLVEATLHRELQRRWLLWRDEVIRAGTVEPEAVRRELAGRQRTWARTPHPGLRGKTPVQAIRAERKKAR